MAAVGRGAQVVLIEPRPDRRAKAAELGVTTTIDPAAGDLVGQSREVTGGDLFDVVIESAGHPDAMAQALTITANRARVVYVGIDVGRTVPAELGLIQARSLRIQGIVGSAGLWPQAIRFLAAGVVDPTPVVTARYPLSAATDALEAASLGSGNIKVHIEAAG
jgi:threonine dehydrogenase-like Zn-dependent dehydrogenase